MTPIRNLRPPTATPADSGMTGSATHPSWVRQRARAVRRCLGDGYRVRRSLFRPARWRPARDRAVPVQVGQRSAGAGAGAQDGPAASAVGARCLGDPRDGVRVGGGLGPASARDEAVPLHALRRCASRLWNEDNEPLVFDHNTGADPSGPVGSFDWHGTSLFNLTTLNCQIAFSADSVAISVAFSRESLSGRHLSNRSSRRIGYRVNLLSGRAGHGGSSTFRVVLCGWPGHAALFVAL